MNAENVLLGIGFGEVLTIVFIIIGLLSSLSQALNKEREKKAEGGEEPVPDLEPIAPNEELRPQKATALEDEINEFLQRAAKGRAGEKRPVQAKPVPIAPQPKAARPVVRPARPVARQRGPVQTPKVEIPVDAEVVELAPRPVGGQVEAKVAKDLDTSAFRRRGDRLGQQTRQETKKIEQQVHAKFDHQLGNLAGETRRPARPRRRPAAALPVIPETGAADFAALFRDVDDVRDVVILNEILTRPVDRWS